MRKVTALNHEESGHFLVTASPGDWATSFIVVKPGS